MCCNDLITLNKPSPISVWVFLFKNTLKRFGVFEMITYLCKTKDGPIVYRLGRQVFILEIGVRFPVGLQNLLEGGRVVKCGRL